MVWPDSRSIAGLRYLVDVAGISNEYQGMNTYGQSWMATESLIETRNLDERTDETSDRCWRRTEENASK